MRRLRDNSEAWRWAAGARDCTNDSAMAVYAPGNKLDLTPRRCVRRMSRRRRRVRGEGTDVEEKKEAVCDGWPGLYTTAEPQNWATCLVSFDLVSATNMSTLPFWSSRSPTAFSSTRHAVTTSSFGHRSPAARRPPSTGSTRILSTTVDGRGLSTPTLRQRPHF